MSDFLTDAVMVAAFPPHDGVVTPTDLPWDERPGVTVRYHIDEHLTPCLRAVLNHPAETVVRRPSFAKEYSL